MPEEGVLVRKNAHPDTGTDIEGTTVPDWEAVQDTILEIAERLSEVPYIGWDVVVTESGFRIVEGNTHPGINTIQTHVPLLEDDRVRRFYRYHFDRLERA